MQKTLTFKQAQSFFPGLGERHLDWSDLMRFDIETGHVAPIPLPPARKLTDKDDYVYRFDAFHVCLHFLEESHCNTRPTDLNLDEIGKPCEPCRLGNIASLAAYCPSGAKARKDVLDSFRREQAGI